MRTVLVRTLRSVEDRILALAPKNWKNVAELPATVYLKNDDPPDDLNGTFIRYGA